MIFWIENSQKINYSDLINDLKSGTPSIESKNYNYYLKFLINLSEGHSISSFENLLEYLKKNSEKLFFYQSTSGTTAEPKLIKVNLKKCLRNIKNTGDKKNSWAMCYPVESFASKQVFFQALFNKDKVVFCFNNDFKKSFNEIIYNKVSNITCTPTFLNMLLLNSSQKANSVKTITVGGEKLLDSLVHSYKNIFPEAKLINIYASTEAGSILYSNDNKFSIPDKYKNFIKIQDEELLIHKSLINKNEETNFINDWFHTNDKVKFMEGNKFVFVERENSYINSGGFRISPVEIEEKIMEVDGIQDVRVFSKPNSFLGSILCAEIISKSLNVKEIKFELSTRLEKFKIPQVIKIVEKIKLTKSGKKKR